MWPTAFNPPDFFCPDYWPRPALGAAPQTGKGKGVGGRHIQALLAQEMSRVLAEEYERTRKRKQVSIVEEVSLSRMLEQKAGEALFKRQTEAAIFTVVLTEL